MDAPRPWITLLVIALAGCVPFYPPPGALRIDPPPRFARLYAEMERCLGRQGNFARVKWWLVPGYAFRRDQWIYEALWSSGHNITLSAWNGLENDALIRHEIAHDLGLGTESHDDPLVLHCTGPLKSTLAR